MLIATELSAPLQQDVLVNLDSAPPPGFERFAQVIEIVSHDPVDAQQARSRWKQYSNQGLKPESNDLGETA